MAKRITSQQKSEMIRMYVEENMSSAQISEIIGVSSSSVLRVLKENGIQVRSKAPIKISNKFSEDKEKEIVRLYVEENKNTNEIAKIFGTYNTSIRRVLLRNNIEIRSYGVAQRKVQLEDIKSKEGTKDFDYFLGLLATDGCVTNNAIVLDFSEENKELLDYWNEFLGNKCNINVSIHKVFKVPQYRISFKNPEIKEYLANFGIKERKTFDLELSYINWDVVRGIIDGDGCVSEANNGSTLKISITSGCRKFLEQVQKFYDQYNITSYLRESDRNLNPTYDLMVYKSEDIIKMYEYLYKDAHYFLKRKEMKFGPLLKKFGKSRFVNSGEESISNPESSLVEDAETLNESSKEDNYSLE